jgi:hypothetical protein
MTVLVILVFLILLLLLATAIYACYFLFQRLMELQLAHQKQSLDISQMLVSDARGLAERTPAELQKLLAAMTKAQEKNAESLLTMMRTAWNPSPETTTQPQPGGYTYPFPVPLGADESHTPDNSDPTDAFLPPHTDYRPNGMVVDAPLPETNPFGIEGMEFKDPLAGLEGR